VLDTDADVLLGPSGPAKNSEQDWVRGQIRQEFRDYASQRAGVVLAFGNSPQPAEGNRLAAEVNRIQHEEVPDVFGPAILRDYHVINRDTSQRGIVDVEVYFLIEVP
jgi:hypothetical protein